MRDRPNHRLGHGLAAQPSGATGLRGLLRARAARARRPCAGWRGGVLTGGSAVARRWLGIAGDLEGVTRKVPGKEERAGTHRNGGSMVRRCKRHRTVAFVSGEGGFGGWRWRVWGPAAPERQGGEKIARNCRDWQLGEELTREWRTTAVLG
jgi:hypothetical protein